MWRTPQQRPVAVFFTDFLLAMMLKNRPHRGLRPQSSALKTKPNLDLTLTKCGALNTSAASAPLVAPFSAGVCGGQIARDRTVRPIADLPPIYGARSPNSDGQGQ